MMKKALLLVISALLFIVTVDGVSASAETKQQRELEQSIRKQVKTKVAVWLPLNVPKVKNKSVTALTKATNNSYTIDYYAFGKSYQVNSNTVKKIKVKKPIMRLQARPYVSMAAAKKKVGYKKFTAKQGSVISINSTLKGYRDAGLGSLWTSWNKGNWAVTLNETASQQKGSLKNLKATAKRVSATKLLSAKQVGTMYLSSKPNVSKMTWQEGNVVYTLDRLDNEQDALTILQSLKK